MTGSGVPKIFGKVVIFFNNSKNSIWGKINMISVQNTAHRDLLVVHIYV